jgi:hypothetical protein
MWASNKEHEERESFKKSFLFVASTLIKKKINGNSEWSSCKVIYEEGLPI